MSEPERFAEDPNAEVLGPLFRALRTEAPRDEAKQHTLAALGLTSPTPSNDLPPTATPAVPVGRVFPWKWFGLGAVGLGVALPAVFSFAPAPAAAPQAAAPAVTASAASVEPPQPPRPDATSPPPSSPERLAEPPPAPAIVAGVRAGGALASPRARTPSPALSAPSPSPPVPPAPSSAGTVLAAPDVTEELAALDRVRASLRAQNPARAMQGLDAYVLSFPHGQLTEEATALRIEALSKAGDVRGARTLAEQFLAAYPASPLTPRIRALVASTEKAP